MPPCLCISVSTIIAISFVSQVWRSSRSLFRQRTAPPGKVTGVLALGQFQSVFQRMVEIVLDGLAVHPAAQKVCPQKFAERRRVLGKSPGAPQLAGQGPERIVLKLAHRLGNILVCAPASLV